MNMNNKKKETDFKNFNFKNNKRAAVFTVALVILITFILHFLVPADYSLASNDRVEKDYKKLNTYISNLDERKIDSAITRANFDVKIQNAGGDEGELDNRFVFKNSVLVGDSMAEGVVDYRILDSSNVFAKRGKRVDSSDDLFSRAVSFNPEHLFVEFGMNDIIEFRGKTKPFIEVYSDTIHDLKKKLPNTKIHIVSISTISDLGIKNNPNMKNFKEYNDAMRKMCAKEKIDFVDTTLLFDENSQYEFDGIHPKEPFYSDWVKQMCSIILEG